MDVPVCVVDRGSNLWAEYLVRVATLGVKSKIPQGTLKRDKLLHSEFHLLMAIARCGFEKGKRGLQARLGEPSCKYMKREILEFVTTCPSTERSRSTHLKQN